MLESAEGDVVGSGRLEPQGDGYFAGDAHAAPGARYRFRLDGSKRLYPDPASRFQPAGPFGNSQVIDPTKFAWSDQRWLSFRPDGQVIYELHIGTFTREGTWTAALEQLPALASPAGTKPSGAMP